jgi:integrase/recombinase XerD
VPSSPAHAVRGPRHSVSKGATRVISSPEATALFEGMDVSRGVGLRDRAMIAVMTYAFASVSAVVALTVEDYVMWGYGHPVAKREANYVK